MKYYILFKSYTEYNQFEGSWDLDFESFDTLKEARSYVKELEENPNIRETIGPLKKL